MQQNAICFRYLVRAAQVNAAGFILESLKSPGPNDVVQLLMQQLKIVSRRVVEDDQIDLQTLVMQVLVSAHDLLHRGHVGGFIDSHHDDRQIAADTVSPEGGLRLGVECEHVRRRTQRGIGVDDAGREALKQVSLFRVNFQMTHLDLCLGPCKTQLAFENIWIVILVGKGERFFTRTCDRSAERTSHRGVGLDSDAAAQAENGIEHRACRI